MGEWLTSVTSYLVDLAESSDAHVQLYNGNGIAITWDHGRFWQHIWDNGDSYPQAFYVKVNTLKRAFRP